MFIHTLMLPVSLSSSCTDSPLSSSSPLLVLRLFFGLTKSAVYHRRMWAVSYLWRIEARSCYQVIDIYGSFCFLLLVYYIIKRVGLKGAAILLVLSQYSSMKSRRVLLSASRSSSYFVSHSCLYAQCAIAIAS